MNLIVKGTAHHNGTQPEPLINIVMSHKVAEETLARLDKPSFEPLPVAWNDIDGRCELIDGTPIHPNYALAVNGRRHLPSPNHGRQQSQILDVSHNVRLFPKWMKNALLIRSRGRCDTLDVTHHSRGSKPTTSNPTHAAAQPDSTTDKSSVTPTTNTNATNNPPDPAHLRAQSIRDRSVRRNRASGTGQGAPALYGDLFGSKFGRHAGGFKLGRRNQTRERAPQHLAALTKCSSNELKHLFDGLIVLGSRVPLEMDQGRFDPRLRQKDRRRDACHKIARRPIRNFDRWDPIASRTR